MKTFASRLKLVMKEKSLNQTDVGKMVGLSRQAVSKYFDEEKPFVPHPNNLKKLCAALDVDYTWLKEGKGKAAKKGKHKPPFIVDKKVDNLNLFTKAPQTFQEPPSLNMDMRSVLETYYKEIDLIKDLLTLKQDSYKKVIFGKPVKQG